MSKQIGIIREIDDLGRICIPKEMRKMLRLEKIVEIQMTTDGVLIKNPEYILVKKDEYNPERKGK